MATRTRGAGRRTRIRFVLAGALALLAAVLVTGALSSIDPTRWDLARLGSLTYLLAGGMAFIEVGTPLGLIAPSELAVPFAGAAAAAGAVSLPVLIAVVWACATAGDSAGFVTGRYAGQRLVTRLQRRRPRAVRHHQALAGHFARHGTATVLVGRWLPYARTATPLVAGASHMAYRRFLLASAVGSGVWAAAMCTLGFAAYRSIGTVTQSTGRAALVVLVIVVAVVVVRRRRARRADPAVMTQIAP